MKVENVILCDDIRQEVNNKLILIGVYTGDLVVPVFPATMRLAILMTVGGLDLGDHEFELKIMSSSGEVGFTGTLTIVSPEEESVVVSSGLPFRFQEAGSLKVQFKMDGKRWIKVMEKAVLLGQPEST